MTAEKKSRFGSLSREPTEEEKAKHAEMCRRMTAIANGKNPDTGKPLRHGDEKTFSAVEKIEAQNWWFVGEPARKLAQDWERWRAYLQNHIVALAEDWRRDKNPIYVWHAYQIARNNDLDLPDWVLDYFDDAAGFIMGILDKFEDGKKAKGKKAKGKKAKETERARVGRALGFGAAGKGKPARFESAVQNRKVWAVYFDVKDLIDNRVKLEAAYNEVASKQKISRSTVVKAYLRIKQLIDNNQEKECS